MCITRRTLHIASMLAWSMTHDLGAQSPVTLAVSGGSATDQRGVRSDALTVAPTFIVAPSEWFSVQLSGNYTSFRNQVWQFGGGGAFATRTAPLGGIAFTLNAGVDATKSSFNATFLSSDATPALEWSAGALTLFGGAHLGSGRTTVTQTTSGPLPGPIPGQTTLVTQSRTTMGPVYGAQLRAGGAIWPSTIVSVRAEDGRLSDGGPVVSDRVATLTLVTGRLSLSGSAGQRRAIDESSDYSSVGASMRLFERMSVEVGAGSYPSNRLLGSPGGRYASAGLSMRLGGPAGMPEPLRPDGVDRPKAGVTRLAIRAKDALGVEVAGDWNGWVPVPAWASANGVWYFDAELPPGEYRYAFRIDGKEWRVPPGASVVDDGFGGKSAFVLVLGTPAGTK